MPLVTTAFLVNKEEILVNTKYIPIAKRSKKEQKEINNAKRGSWGGLNPVTRRPENPKAYNRNKAKAALRREEY